MKTAPAVLLAAFLLSSTGCTRPAGSAAPPGEVAILRDPWGIAHVRAADEEGAFFGAGYAMAQDRMFQMMLRRRIVQGRLAEILGPGQDGRILRSDRKYRILGLHRKALSGVSSLSPTARRRLEAFARGVNLYLGRNEHDLLPLFARYGGRPEPWQPSDSLALCDLFAERFTAGWENEAVTALKPPQPARADAVPKAEWPNPDDSAEIVSAGEFRRNAPGVYERLRRRTGDRQIGLRSDPAPEVKASHNWAVSGALSTTGRPILESDPQLTVELPSFGYEVHLDGGGLNARGLCFPGVPGIWIGFNSDCAWGVTALGGDNADLFEESIDPANARRYRWRDTWENFEVRTETIRVKGSSPVTFDVRSSRHGPVVNDLLPAAPAGKAYALRMQILFDSQSSLEAVMNMMSAGGWNEFRSALQGFVGPPLHLLYADSRGDIGYQALVRTPIRSRLSTIPRSGWTGAEEWQLVPFEELPFLLNPLRGLIFTANHLAAGSWYPYPIGVARGDGPRSLRLRELLEPGRKYSVGDFTAIHRDSVNPVVRDFARLLVALADEGALPTPELRAAVEPLRGWDGQLLTHSPAYPLGAGILLALQENMTDTWLMGYGGSWPGLCLLFKEMMPAFRRTSRVAADARIRGWLTAKFARAVELSRSRHDLTRVPYVHRMPYQDNGLGVGSLDPGDDLESPPLRSPVVQTIWSQTGAMYVQIVILGDPDGSLSLMPPGISENPASAHFRDQMGLWAAGELHPAPLTRAAVDRYRRSEVRLSRDAARR
jgi:penicillin amidase